MRLLAPCLLHILFSILSLANCCKFASPVFCLHSLTSASCSVLGCMNTISKHSFMLHFTTNEAIKCSFLQQIPYPSSHSGVTCRQPLYLSPLKPLSNARWLPRTANTISPRVPVGTLTGSPSGHLPQPDPQRVKPSRHPCTGSPSPVAPRCRR